MLQRNSLKSMLLIILALLMMLSLCACKDNAFDKANDVGDNHQNSKDNKDNVKETDDGKMLLDAFDGLEYVVSGISPYCQISINNQNCSADVQKYVTYSLDKEYYANGETAIITAMLDKSLDAEHYVLTTTEYTYMVRNQPEYIADVDGIDLAHLQSELEDYITAQISSSIGESEFFNTDSYDGLDLHVSAGGWGWTLIIEDVDKSLCRTHLSALKLNKTDKMSSKVPYNKLTFVYCFDVHADINPSWYNTYSHDLVNSIQPKSDQIWVAISAYNIVMYSDGTIKWGSTGPDAYDFIYATSTEGLEHCITTCIMNGSANYNISEVK